MGCSSGGEVPWVHITDMMVLDVFVYHKYSKSHGWFGTSLAAKTASVEVIDRL